MACGQQRPPAASPPQLPPSARGSRIAWAAWAAWAGLIALTLAAYLPSVLVPFPWFVEESITFQENPWMGDLDVGNWIGLVQRPHYRDYTPLGWTYQFLVAGLAGRDNVSAIRVASVVLHLLVVLAGWRLLRLMVPGRPWLVWTVAALYAIHPMSVEQAVWVPAQKWLLSVWLALLAMHVWWRARGGTPTADIPTADDVPPLHRGRATLAGALFLLALLCKGGVIILPLVLLAAEWTVGRLPLRRALWRVAPMLGIAVLFGLSSALLLGDAANSVAWVGGNPLTSFVAHLPALWTTVWHWTAPLTASETGLHSGLSFYYGIDAVPDVASALLAIGKGALALVVLGLAWLAAGRTRLATFSAAWFLLSQLLVMGLIPHQWWPMADRYTSFGGWGVALLGGLALSNLLRVGVRPEIRPRFLIGLPIGALLAAGGINAMTQLQWTSPDALRIRALIVSPRSPFVLQSTLLQNARNVFADDMQALPLERSLSSLEMREKLTLRSDGSGIAGVNVIDLIRAVMATPGAADLLYIDSTSGNLLLLALIERQRAARAGVDPAANDAAGPLGRELIAHAIRYGDGRPGVVLRVAIYHACRGRMDLARPWLDRFRQSEIVRWPEIVAHSSQVTADGPLPDNTWFIRGNCDYVRQIAVRSSISLFLNVAVRDAVSRNDPDSVLQLVKAARMMYPDCDNFRDWLRRAEAGTLPGLTPE